VVGDGDAVYPQFPAPLDDFFQGRLAVYRVFGVYMKVGFQ
jgi:hypothetical protein